MFSRVVNLAAAVSLYGPRHPVDAETTAWLSPYSPRHPKDEAHDGRGDAMIGLLTVPRGARRRTLATADILDMPADPLALDRHDVVLTDTSSDLC